MNKKILKLSVVAVGILLLSACSDSGDSSDSAGSGNNDTINILAPQSGTQSHMFYGNSNHANLGSIKNVSVIDPTVPDAVAVANDILDVRYPVVTTTLTYDADSSGYTDLYVDTLSYVSGGAPYKVSLAKGGAAPTEVANSSDTDLSGVSYKKLNYLGSKQYLTATKSDGNSSLITSGMSGSDSSLDFNNRTLLTLSYPSFGEAPNGYIVYDSNASGSGISKLQNCLTNMTSCADIQEVTSSYKFYGDIAGTTLSAIAVDDKLYKFDKSNNSMTEITLSTISLADIGRSEVSGDSLYGVFDSNISRINIESGVVTQISTDGLADRFRAFTSDMVIYGGDDQMHAVNKDGSNKDAAIEISVTTKTRGQKYPYNMAIGNQYLYTTYSVNTSTGKTTFYACKLENGQKECRTDSFWAAITAAKDGQFNFDSTYKYTPYAYIRVDDTDNYGGGTLRAIDPAKPLEGGIALGTIETFNFQTFMQNSRYVDEMVDSEGNVIIYGKNDLDFRGDAFLVNLNSENSLKNLTNEEPPTEAEINDPAKTHCHGRFCTVCHSFAGGKIYEDKAGTAIATGYNIRFEFEDASESILARIGKGVGENFNIPLEDLVGKNFKAVVVDENGTGSDVVNSIGFLHKGAEYFNCNFCHARDVLRHDAPNVITIED